MKVDRLQESYTGTGDRVKTTRCNWTMCTYNLLGKCQNKSLSDDKVQIVCESNFTTERVTACDCFTLRVPEKFEKLEGKQENKDDKEAVQ